MKKKGDLLIIGAVVLCAAVAAWMWLMPAQRSASLCIYHNDQLIATLPMDEDTRYPIQIDGNENVVEIHDGKASMVSANCPDLICVNSPAIGHDGETIVCLPHGIVLKATGGEAAPIDGLAQ